MSKPEILAPVGNRAMLEAAVRAGADAVYLGMSDFNARRGAENFDRDAFREAVKYCRIRGVRVYLTLNTIVSDEEIPAALSLAAYAYECGADAVIVQDLGLARLLHERMPDFPLHASTQMSVHSPAALKLLKKLGFVQVVVSREMSREELRAFCACASELGIRVEVFVHGALCMCVSGQCYLSALLGSRSGNRGLCAGPCRLPFSATEEEAYDLSLKDLSLVEHLNDLAALGVSSFKIEGRLKRPEYVAVATAVCRKVLDGEECDEWKEALLCVFSRSGFTDGYYTARLGREMFGTRGKEEVLLSSQVLGKIHELYRFERQSVPLKGTFVLALGSPAVLELTDGVNSVRICGAVPTAAQNRAITLDEIRAKLIKTGNTPFVFTELDVSAEDGLFYPASGINALRRVALEELEQKRAACNRSAPLLNPWENSPYSAEKKGVFIASFLSPSQIPEDLSGVSSVILPIESDWENASFAPELVLSLPRGMSDETPVRERLYEAKQRGVSRILCGNLSGAQLVLEAGLVPVFDFSLNLFSSEALETARLLGAGGAVCSFELRERQLMRLSSALPLGIVVYGRLPLMLTRNCPVRNRINCNACKGMSTLTDRRDVRFPVRCRNGFSELFNSRPLWLADRLSDFSADFFVLQFTVETSDECARVLKAYRKRGKPIGEFTRGLYYRGVE